MSHDKHEHHIVPFGDYIKVFSVLIVLTFITVVASRFDFGTWNTIVAMGIASVKAGLVLAIFMHLKYDDKLNLMIFLNGLFFLLVFFGFCFLDVSTRFNWTPK